MIVNVRGTHGSGKSTLAAELLRKYGGLALFGGLNERRPLGHLIEIPKLSRPLYLVGPYITACGGCDAVQPYDLIWPRVEQYAEKGHVFFEGALVSSSVGAIGRAMAARKCKDCVVLFMDTPVEVCIERIQARRKARGDDRPLNPRNTVVKHEAVLRSRPKLEALGLRCATLNHKKAFKQLMEVLLENKKGWLGRAQSSVRTGQTKQVH